jgi:hypothetical protein
MADAVKAAKASYDTIADTFYFTVSREKPGRYREDDDGLVWRFNETGHPIGVTVQAYRRLWTGRRSLLAARIAEQFAFDADAVARRLPPERRASS